MDKKFILECLLSLVGGMVGASVSALGSFLIFGLLGTIGFFYLITIDDPSLLMAVTGGVLFLPHVSFIGGAVAIAYARKKGYIECGKDIGRSVIAIQRVDVLAVGAIAGLAGYLLNRLLQYSVEGLVDTIALTVVLIPLVLKYLWGLTKTNDCEGSSHAVPSPFRFFERLNKPAGKIVVSFVMGVVAALLVLIYHPLEHTTHYSEMLLFFISAASLYLLFFKVSIPATHHMAASSGVIMTTWLAVQGPIMTLEALFLLILWSCSFSLLATFAADGMKKLLFDAGDIHIDPPAMGIVICTATALGVFPKIGIYSAEFEWQFVVAALIGIVSLFLNLILFGNE